MYIGGLLKWQAARVQRVLGQKRLTGHFCVEVPVSRVFNEYACRNTAKHVWCRMDCPWMHISGGSVIDKCCSAVPWGPVMLFVSHYPYLLCPAGLRRWPFEQCYSQFKCAPSHIVTVACYWVTSETSCLSWAKLVWSAVFLEGQSRDSNRNNWFWQLILT